MKEYQSLSHTRRDCKYHVVFILKRRKKLIFGKLRKHIGEVLRDLANQRESAIAMARQLGRGRNFTGESFRARGYFVSTVGLDEEMIRAYIREQEKEDERYDQLKLGMWVPL